MFLGQVTLRVKNSELQLYLSGRLFRQVFIHLAICGDNVVAEA
jgi:hypothetical protein